VALKTRRGEEEKQTVRGDCLPDERPQALVVVSDHKLHAAQAAVGQGAQEVGPERLGLGWTGRDAQNLALAVLVDCDGHYHGTADDAPALADLHVGGIEPKVRPGPLQGPRQERVHALVDLGAQPTDPGSGPGQALALRHAAFVGETIPRIVS